MQAAARLVQETARQLKEWGFQSAIAAMYDDPLSPGPRMVGYYSGNGYTCMGLCEGLKLQIAADAN
jgi:hypothetical protein